MLDGQHPSNSIQSLNLHLFYIKWDQSHPMQWQYSCFQQNWSYLQTRATSETLLMTRRQLDYLPWRPPTSCTCCKARLTFVFLGSLNDAVISGWKPRARNKTSSQMIQAMQCYLICGVAESHSTLMLLSPGSRRDGYFWTESRTELGSRWWLRGVF